MQSVLSERPNLPFVVSLVGLIVLVIASLVVGVAGTRIFGTFGDGNIMGGMMGGYYGGTGMMNGYAPWGMSGLGEYSWVWIPLLVASVALAAVGVFMINSTILGNVRMGSVLVIIAAVLAFPTAFGFVVGSVLLITGGILGLVWSPSR